MQTENSGKDKPCGSNWQEAINTEVTRALSQYHEKQYKREEEERTVRRAWVAQQVAEETERDKYRQEQLERAIAKAQNDLAQCHQQAHQTSLWLGQLIDTQNWENTQRKRRNQHQARFCSLIRNKDSATKWQQQTQSRRYREELQRSTNALSTTASTSLSLIPSLLDPPPYTP